MNMNAQVDERINSAKITDKEKRREKKRNSKTIKK